MNNNTPDDNMPDTPETSTEVQQELSKVATNPKKNILILVVIGLAIAYIMYYFFFSGKEPQAKKEPVALPTDVSKPTQLNLDNAPSIPALPEPPKLIEPPAPAPQLPSITDQKEEELPSPTGEAAPLPLPPSALPKDGIPSGLITNEEEQKRKEAKWKANIILLAGNPNPKTPEQIKQEADFKERGDMTLLLSRGKIIDAVLETAINTDFGGEIRALVSRDIFSESGKVILVPKGSRVFGTYTTGIDGGYGRVAVNWFRLDLASGYTVNLAGSAVDGLGRAGITGRVDHKYKEKFANSVLVSAFNIALAKGLDKIVPPVDNSTAATTNQAAATQLGNIALGIFNDATLAPAAKISLICAQVQTTIPDKTSAAYLTFVSTCNNIGTVPGGTPEQQLNAIMIAVNTAATAIVAATNQVVTPSQAQDASKQAFTDVTDTVKDMLKQDQFKTTITVDQGSHIKIYVTKDFNFPKKAINKKRIK